MAYNKKHNIVNNGTNYRERVVVQQPTDGFKAIFNNKEVDINGPGVTKYNYTGKKYDKFEHTTNSKYQGEKVNFNMVELLNKSNFYNLDKNTTKKNTAIHGFTFSQQKGKKSSTIDSAVQAWTKLNKLRTNEVGSLFTFDTETVGGTSTDKRWNPLAMTEFAVQEYNFATKQRKTTNIIMANKENIVVLDNIMKRYEEAYAKGGDIIKNDNELWVSAMRLSLYDPTRGANFKLNEKGYYEADKLIDSSEHMAGNIESVRRGYNALKKISKHMEDTKDVTTGLTKDALEYIKVVGKMQTYSNNGVGIISGHNIIDFDRAIVDMGVNKIYQTQLDILNSKDSEKEAKTQALNALKYINESFGIVGNNKGEYKGLSFNKGSVLDTMTITRMVRDSYGETAIYGDNKKAFFRPELDKWGNKSASLEAITHALYPNEVKENVAHLAAFDALLNQHIILKGSESLNGRSFIEHAMEYAGGSGVMGLTKKEGAIISLDSNKMFKATSNFAQSNYSGRGFLNSVVYANGEVFTNGGFHIDTDGMVSHTEYSGNTGFAKGTFYNLTKQNKIKISDLGEDVQEQIRKSYPELNSEYLFSASFASNHVASGKIGHTVNIVTTTQDELEGIISSNLTHVATNENDEWKLVQNNIGHLKTSVFKHKTGKVYTNKLKGKTDKEKLMNAIKISDDIISSDRARRSVLKSNSAVKKVHDILNFDKELMSTDLGKKVSAALENGYSMSDILTHNHAEGYLNKKELGQVQNLFLKSAGYTHNGKQKIDFRTKQNLAYAYDNVITRKEYYEKLIGEVKNNFNITDLKDYWYGDNTKNNRNAINNFFLDLDRKVKTSVALNIASPNQDIIDLANEVKGVSIGTAEEFKNRYDFKLGKKFKKVGKTPQKILGPFASYDEEDIVTFNVGKNGATTSFVNGLYKKYMGDKDNPRRTDKEAQTKQAVYNFFMDLSNNREENKELFEYQELKDVIKKMKENGLKSEDESDSLGINQPISVLQRAIEYAKKKNAGAGIVKGYGSRYNINDSNKTFIKELNNVSAEEIKSNVKSMVKNISYGNDEQRQVEIKKIIKSFSVSDGYFTEKTKHLDEERIKILKLIQQDVESKMEIRLNDIMKTCGYFDMDVYFNGHDIVVGNGDGTGSIIDSLPRFKINDGVAYLESGNSKLGLNLRTAVRGKNKDAKIYLTTNLDENFGKKDYFYDMFLDKKYRNEKPNSIEFNKYINFHKANLRESSLYTGGKYDAVYLNSKFDVSEAYEKLYKDIFSDDGSLNHVLDKVKLANPEMVDVFKKNQHKLKDGNVPPDLYMFGIPDMIEILGNVLDENDPNYENLKYLFSIAGPGNKDTELSKGHLLLGNRVLGTLSNKYDNVARPPMYGSGNIQFLEKSKIKAVGENSLVLAHSIAESEETMKIIHRNSIEGGLTSDFTYRQAFISAPIINERMKSQKEIILNSNINNKTIQQMTEKQKSIVYDKLIETVSSHTHEQARVMDARTFKGIINMPMNTQYLSPNLDIIEAFNEDTNQERVALLNELVGNISINSNGEISYKRSKGTIVKKGEAVVEYGGFGGINNVFGSKMNKGNLSFSVRDIDDIELSESSINKILNKHADKFEGLTHHSQLNEFINIMKAEGYKTSFKVDNINNASLPKLLSGGSEKGMTLLLQSTIGELNENNREFFESLTNYAEKMGLDKTKYDFAGQNIITQNAVESALQDIARHANKHDSDKRVTYIDIFNSINKDSYGFKNINDLMSSIVDEQVAKSEMIFGKYGAFNGITSLANDNIPKHGNIGLGTFGKFSEAVALYGKALDKNHEFSAEGYYSALNVVKDLMNNDENLNFFGETVDGSTKKGRAKKLSIKDGTLVVENTTKNENEFLNGENFENLIQKIDELIVKSYGGDESKINESDRLKHENINIPDGKGGYKKGTFYGSAIIRESNGERYADATVAMMNNSLVRDGETMSGVTQEYIDLNIAINKLKTKTSLTLQEREDLALMQTKVSAMKDSVKFMKLDDQAVAILQQHNFSEQTALELEAALKSKENPFSMGKAKYLEDATGSLIHIDDDQRFIINKELSKNKNTNEIWLNKLKDSRYFNEFRSEELTPDLLEKNPHLQEVYNYFIGQGITPKLGVEEAQDLYDLRRMDAAALFNKTNKYDIETMQNKYGYKIMHIDDFVSAEGSAQTETIDDILKQNVLIDIGEHFGKGNDRYVAAPGTGKVVGTEEIRSGWQKNIDQLKRYNDSLKAMEGDGITSQFNYDEWSKMSDMAKKEALEKTEIKESAIQYRMELMGKMKKTADDIGELTNHYNRKGGLFTQYSKIDIIEAQQRMKITSITGDLVKKELFDGTDLEGTGVDISEAFMKTAKITMADGTKNSLHDLESKGIYYDYKRVGIEYFENAGYFDDKMIKSFGFENKQQMIEHLKENGTITTSTRYPQIKSDSIYQSRTYLDETFNGTNTVSVAAHSMLKYKGDSDGDSESFFETRVDGINFALYDKKRQEAVKKVKEENKELSKLDFTKKVKETMLKDETITKDAYDYFNVLNAEMARVATIDNAEYVAEVKATQLKDIRSNIFTGASSIKYENEEGEKTIFQIKNAVSNTLSSIKMEPIREQPKAEDLEQNINLVNNYIKKAYETNPDAFSEKTKKYAKNIFEGNETANKIAGANKYTIIDEALAHFEKDSSISKDELYNIETAFTKRIRINHLFEEEAAKAGKGAIAPVNTSLYALKVAGKQVFGDTSSEFYDSTKAGLISRMAYQIEESAISSKKVSYDLGDTRLLDIENILNQAKKGHSDSQLKNDLAEWFDTYVDSGVTEDMWRGISETELSTMKKNNTIANRIKHIQGVFKGDINSISDDEWKIKAKNSIMAEKLLNSVNEIVSNNGGKSLVNALGSFGRNGSLAESMGNVGAVSNITMGSETLNFIRDVPISEVNKVTEITTKPTYDATKYVKDYSDDIIAGLSEKVLSNTPKVGGLGLAALGVAAGLLVAGYAGGHNVSRPTPPVDDTQPPPQTVPEFFDQQVSSVQPTGDQRGYVINVKADTNRGERHMKKAMKEAVRATSASRNISVNMNYRTTRSGGYSNKDIEDIINNYI